MKNNQRKRGHRFVRGNGMMEEVGGRVYEKG